jgi:hypothetical protein
MNDTERRCYATIEAYLNRLAIRAHARWKDETTQAQQWEDDGGAPRGPPSPAR